MSREERVRGDNGCPVCFAPPGDACTTPGGLVRNDHKARATAGPIPTQRVQLLPPGFCLNCAHPEEAHRPDGTCDTEVRDYGDLDCTCPGLKLCAACEGDPEAHGLHVCGRSS